MQCAAFDYLNLQGYLMDLISNGHRGDSQPDHIKRQYFTHDDINPTRIIPIGLPPSLPAGHGRSGEREWAFCRVRRATEPNHFLEHLCTNPIDGKTKFQSHVYARGSPVSEAFGGQR
jgi:hypothetical protein